MLGLVVVTALVALWLLRVPATPKGSGRAGSQCWIDADCRGPSWGAPHLIEHHQRGALRVCWARPSSRHTSEARSPRMFALANWCGSARSCSACSYGLGSGCVNLDW